MSAEIQFLVVSYFPGKALMPYDLWACDVLLYQPIIASASVEMLSKVCVPYVVTYFMWLVTYFGASIAP